MNDQSAMALADRNLLNRDVHPMDYTHVIIARAAVIVATLIVILLPVIDKREKGSRPWTRKR